CGYEVKDRLAQVAARPKAGNSGYTDCGNLRWNTHSHCTAIADAYMISNAKVTGIPCVNNYPLQHSLIKYEQAAALSAKYSGSHGHHRYHLQFDVIQGMPLKHVL
ncbi:MAG TPA: hypothetical protein DD738_15710, partial [Ruminiclostridium sp.]|nr:hypothetical protein [Ruminiclostridium sp.]